MRYFSLTLSLSFFFIFLSPYPDQLKAQCVFYGYYLDIDGFNCGSDEGTICLVTNADILANFFDCIEYVVDIEFPTGNFIYTDLDDFYLQDFNSSTTTLRTQPVPNSDGDLRVCLDGLLQVPNTVFTLTVVNPNDPTDILSTTTFQLDNAIPVVENGNTVLLSSLIVPGGPLLPAAQATSTGQRISIDGTLIVDTDYRFGTNNQGGFINDITLFADASIETLEGQSIELRFLRSHLHGCKGQSRWEELGIREGNSDVYMTRTLVEGAKSGVDMDADAGLYLLQTTLNNNQRGIASTGPDFRDISIVVSASPFQASWITSGSYGGYFENVENLYLNYLNFKGNSTGVYLESMNSFNGNNLYFTDNDIGIDAKKKTRYFTLRNTVMGQGFIGIRAYDYRDFTITDCNINGHNLGIGIYDNRFNSTATIENNQIYCDQGIFAIPRPSRAEIQFNDFIGSGYNMALIGNYSGDHRWAFQHNNVVFAGLNATSYGNVILMNTNRARVFRNLEMLSDDGPGIAVYGGSNNYLGYNSIDADEEGILVNNSPMSLLYCNAVQSDIGMRILNNCAGSDIRGNDFSLSGNDNLLYGSHDNTMAIGGVQAYQGNIFSNSSLNSTVAKHFGTPFEIGLSKYQVNQLNTQGNSSYPFFDAAADDWFDPIGYNDEYECPNGIPVPDPIEEEVKWKNASIAEYLAKPSVAEFYNSEAEGVLELQMARHIQHMEIGNESLSMELMTAMNDPDHPYYDFINTPSADNSGFSSADELPMRAESTLAVEETLKGLITLSPEDEEALLNLKLRLRGIEASLSTVGDILLLNEDETVSLDHDAYNRQKEIFVELAAAQGEIDLTVAGQEANLQTNLASIISSNATINTDGVLAYEVKKEVNAIALRLLQEGNQMTSTEFKNLKDYAQLCAAIGGEGVYLARALVAQHSEDYSLNYNDECLGGQKKSKASNDRTTGTTVDGLSLYPNPAKNNSSLQLGQKHGFHQLELIGASGKIYLQQRIDADDYKLIIDSSQLPAGTYFVHLYGEERSEFLRLLVQ